MTAPNQLRAGDSAAWSIDLPDYPSSDGWSLHYRLLFPAAAAADIATTADGTLHTVTLSADQTAAWAPGAATLVHWVERGASPNVQRITLGSAPIGILPNLTAAPVHDNRSQAQRALDDARGALAAHLASGRAHVQSYSIAGRSMQFRSVQELRDLIAYYESEVAKERSLRAALYGGSGRIVTRM